MAGVNPLATMLPYANAAGLVPNAGYTNDPYTQPASTYASYNPAPARQVQTSTPQIQTNSPTQAAPSATMNLPALQSAVSQQDLDNAFNPIFSALGQDKTDANNALNLVNTNIGNDAATATGQVNAYGTQADNQFTSDKQNLDQQAATQYSQANQTYNQLAQKYLNMFGGGGTSQDLLGLLSQGNQQETGSIGSGYSQALTDLTNQHAAAHLWVGQQNAAIQSQAETDKNNAMIAFTQQIDNINNMEGQAQEQKAAAKISAAASLQQALNGITIDAIQKSVDLQTWMQNVSGNVNQQAGQLAAQQAAYLASNPFSGVQTPIQGLSSVQAQAPTSLPGFNFSNQNTNNDPLASIGV